MPFMQIEVTAVPSASDREAVLDGLLAFIRAETDQVPVSLAVLVRDEAGTVVGGLTGHTTASWLYVELLSLLRDCRRMGD